MNSVYFVRYAFPIPSARPLKPASIDSPPTPFAGSAETFRIPLPNTKTINALCPMGDWRVNPCHQTTTAGPTGKAGPHADLR